MAWSMMAPVEVSVQTASILEARWPRVGALGTPRVVLTALVQTWTYKFVSARGNDLRSRRDPYPRRTGLQLISK